MNIVYGILPYITSRQNRHAETFYKVFYRVVSVCIVTAKCCILEVVIRLVISDGKLAQRKKREEVVARPKGRTETVYAAFRVAEDVGLLWNALAEHLSLSKTAVFTLALKRLAAAEKITILPRKADAVQTPGETD